MTQPAAGGSAEWSAEWSVLHHGIEAQRVPFLRTWLHAMWWLARPLVRLRVAPLAVTFLGALFALDAVLLAGSQPSWALLLVLLSVLCDGLDGAVALLASRVSVRGAYADKVADRIADTAFAAVLWRCGAPWWLALSAGGLSLLHEGLRTVLGGARLRRLTVAERPTRTICAALACGSAAVSSETWPPTVCAAVWIGLAVVGLAQLR